jgi:hypothetical protein
MTEPGTPVIGKEVRNLTPLEALAAKHFLSMPP